MYISAAGSTWHGINYFSFCGSLLGNTLHQEIKESNSTEVVKSKLREMFLTPVLCFDKYQRCIQNPVGFNSFKPLTVYARRYVLEAGWVSAYPSEFYYMNRFNWCFLFCFFISRCLLAFILDFDPMINKTLIMILITDPLRTVELSCLVDCSYFYLEWQIYPTQDNWSFY